MMSGDETGMRATWALITLKSVGSFTLFLRNRFRKY
ncbi:MAG: hypothetical protein ACJAQT_001649 [Akkermansiaceae bacterium]|jgi:hypothetical protein